MVSEVAVGSPKVDWLWVLTIVVSVVARDVSSASAEVVDDASGADVDDSVEDCTAEDDVEPGIVVTVVETGVPIALVVDMSGAPSVVVIVLPSDVTGDCDVVALVVDSSRLVWIVSDVTTGRTVDVVSVLSAVVEVPTELVSVVCLSAVEEATLEVVCSSVDSVDAELTLSVFSGGVVNSAIEIAFLVVSSKPLCVVAKLTIEGDSVVDKSI